MQVQVHPANSCCTRQNVRRASQDKAKRARHQACNYPNHLPDAITLCRAYNATTNLGPRDNHSGKTYTLSLIAQAESMSRRNHEGPADRYKDGKSHYGNQKQPTLLLIGHSLPQRTSKAREAAV